jgi:arylsulfatase A-like enzyme
MCFTDAHATSAVCTPSRYSIITGRYNWLSQLKSYVLGGFSAPLIDENRKTVAQLLKRADTPPML